MDPAACEKTGVAEANAGPLAPPDRGLGCRQSGGAFRAAAGWSPAQTCVAFARRSGAGDEELPIIAEHLVALRPDGLRRARPTTADAVPIAQLRGTARPRKCVLKHGQSTRQASAIRPCNGFVYDNKTPTTRQDACSRAA